MCRHTLASIGAFLTFDNLAEIVKSYLRSANVNKCSHNGSYHIPEEAVGGYGEHIPATLVFP